MSRYGTHLTSTQTEPIRGRTDHVVNNAGGYVFEVSPMAALDRFLILGSEGGTYYATERKLTRENVTRISAMIAENGTAVLARTVEISLAGRAPKHDPAIFVLALCLEAKVQGAREAVGKICRTGTHLFHLARDLRDLGAFNKNAIKAIRRWYETTPVDKLALQVVKYQQRDGWSQRDLLRLTHPVAVESERDAVFRYVTDGEIKAKRQVKRNGEMVTYAIPAKTKAPRIIEGVQSIKTATVTDACGLIREYRLPREVVPTEMLNDTGIWESLLQSMPIGALVRNLGKLSSLGMTQPLGAITKQITAQLGDVEQIKRSRLHPIEFLKALLTYQQGHGTRGSLTWTVNRQISDALDAGFYLAFGNVKPTGKNFLFGVDISGSMDGGVIAGCPGLSPRLASAAMMMVTARVEPNWHAIGFTSGGAGITPLEVSKTDRLDRVCQYMARLPMGRTDCAMPMIYADVAKIDADMFVVLTDNETYAGIVHPTVAMAKYRRNRVKDARLAVIGMTATSFTIADPKDPRQMDLVGFDSATPTILSAFANDFSDTSVDSSEDID